MRGAEAAARRVGNEPDLTIILFTLDETSYARELAPLAGVYPALRLGPPWWFHDSPEGMRGSASMATETAGFYNTVGFNDDTRAFPSIPARHDVARRVDCAYPRAAGRRAPAATRTRRTRWRATSPTGCPSGLQAVRPNETPGRRHHETVRTPRSPACWQPPRWLTATFACANRAALCRYASRWLSDRRGGQAYRARTAEAGTEGRYSVEVFHSAQLGEEKDTIEQTQFGVIDLNRISIGAFGTQVPEDRDPSLPYNFRSADHMHKVLDGPIGEEILGAFEPHGLSWRWPFTTAAPARSTTAKSRSPRCRHEGHEDARHAVRHFRRHGRGLGANATPMPYGEVYSGIQTGVIDGAENNWPSYDTAGHAEVAKYYSLDEHSMVPEVLVMSKIVWDGLTPEDQALFREAAKESVSKQRELWAAKEIESKAAVEAPAPSSTTVDKEPFIAAMGPVYDKYVTDPKLQDLVARIQATQ